MSSPSHPIKVTVNMSKANHSSINSKESSNYLMFNKNSSNMNNLGKIPLKVNDSNTTIVNESKKILSSRKNTSSANPKEPSNHNKLSKNNILKFSKSGSKEKIDRTTTENSSSKLDLTGVNTSMKHSFINKNQLSVNNSKQILQINKIIKDSKEKDHQHLKEQKDHKTHNGNKDETVNLDKQGEIEITENKDQHHNKESTDKTEKSPERVETHEKFSETHVDKVTFVEKVENFLHNNVNKQNHLSSGGTKGDLLINQKINNFLVEKKLGSPSKDHKDLKNLQHNSNLNSHNTQNKFIPLKAKATSLNTKKNQTVCEIKILNSSHLKHRELESSNIFLIY